jgi:hypothetical protein
VTDKRPLRISYCALVAAVVASLVFLPALRNGFAYDDAAVVVQDARVHSLEHIGTILRTGYWAAESGHALYRPITTLSFALDWSLAPASGTWFHLTNLLGHAFATALVVLVLARFFSPLASLLGGLIFAVHPVHVEAVANVVGRADVFAAVFSLAACLLWITQSTLPTWRYIRLGGVAVLYSLALLTKESAIMLPALLILVDVASGWLRHGGVLEYLRRNASAFSILAVVVAAFLAVRVAVLGGWAPSRVDPALDVAADPFTRVLTALQTWPVYLRILIFPRTLLADYGPRIITPAVGLTFATIAGLMLLAGCLAGGVLAFVRGHRHAVLGLLWFPIAMLPVSNLLFPIGVLVAERTMYLPSFALSVGVAGAATAAWRFRANPVFAVGTRVAAVAVLVILAVRTLYRVPEWQSTDRIMIALVRDRPDAFRGQWHLARMARMSGDTAAAIQRYGEAMRLWPHREGLVVEAAVFAGAARQLRLSYDLAATAVRSWPNNITTQRLLAGAALDLGDTATARAAVQQGLRIDPRDDLLRRMNAAIFGHQTTAQR